jgi:serine/threonine-protein kinase
MFVREAKILSDLRHPSIVPVLEFGEEDGIYVMVLEYIRGYHVGQWHKYLRKLQRTIPADVLLLLMVDVLEALHKAHGMVHPDGSSMHIVHRDVSPSNILLDEDGRARLLDFGVARMRGGNVEYQTQIQSFVGKFTYSAPELFGGAEATPRSDLYSVGVVLHEALFGRNVFSAAEDALTLNNVLNHVPERIEPLRPDAPRGLDAVLAKALAKEPEQRFASAQDFANALRALLSAPESSVRARIVGLLKEDFSDAMANALGIDSLFQRDQAWRDYGVEAEPGERTVMLDADELGEGEAETSQGGDSHVRPSSRSRSRASLTGSAPLPKLATGALPRPAVPAPPPNSRAFATATMQIQRPARFSDKLTAQRVVLAIVSCLAVAAIAVVLRPAPPPAAPTKVIRIVQPDPAQALREAQARAAALAAAEATARQRAVGERQPQIDACFARKARGRAPATDMALVFEVDPKGAPLEVAVTPASLANTPLGRCLRTAGKGVRFPAAQEASSFSVPVGPGN